MTGATQERMLTGADILESAKALATVLGPRSDEIEQ